MLTGLRRKFDRGVLTLRLQKPGSPASAAREIDPK